MRYVEIYMPLFNNMLIKNIFFGEVTPQDWITAIPSHKSVVYIQESNKSKAQIQTRWDRFRNVQGGWGASENCYNAAIDCDVVGGGFPYFNPGVTNVNIQSIRDYDKLLRFIPYSAPISGTYSTANYLAKFSDKYGNGIAIGDAVVYVNNGVAVGGIGPISNSRNLLGLFGVEHQDDTYDVDASFIFISADGQVGWWLSPWGYSGNLQWFDANTNDALLSWLYNLPDLSIDPYADGGSTVISTPNGDFDDTSDPIDFPALPTLGAVDSGFITLFNPDLAELQALAHYMWTNPLFDISAWKKIFADPMDAILGLSIVPVPVPDGSARPIVVGNIVTDVSMKPATAQFIEVQCGALNVNEFWSAYLDYEPYTKAEIYLPFCGVHQLSVDDIMNKTVEVRYHIDILSGACCAYVKCGESVLYQFIGQCASSIPISGTDFTNVINGVLSAATAIGSLVATGGASAPLAVPALSATALNALKPNIEKSGAMGGTGGMLAMQKPYLILTRPKQAHPANQNHYTGYPSFITENLSELSGYTEIEEIHLENVQATDSELDEIVNLLKNGVIF